MAANSEFKHLQITHLHPTFGAEILGVDFSKHIPDEVFEEILKASAKVCVASSLVCSFLLLVVDTISLISWVFALW